ncbi:MAG: hypothetical protein Dbin4_01409 [Alphaproteobacteria bacterium]|nr:hypothetical protein [Alphaproteobacteria bacterium]
MRHDHEVRPLLRERLAEMHPGALVIDELGLDYGGARVDLAVVGEALHGYEIKAEADTLKRLRVQSEMYGHVLDTVTLVASPAHLAKAADALPSWWGLWSISESWFNEVRPAAPNPGISPHRVAMLLWRDEMRVVAERTTRRRMSRANKTDLRRLLSEVLTADEIRSEVRRALRARPMGWQNRTGLGPPSARRGEEG